MVGITIHCIFAYKQNKMKKNYTEQTTRQEIVGVAQELKVVLDEYQVEAILRSFNYCRMQDLTLSNEEVISKIILIIFKEQDITFVTSMYKSSFPLEKNCLDSKDVSYKFV